MNTRSKLIAAVLGLAVAAGAIGDASATTIGKTVKARTVVTKSVKLAAPTLHRLHVGTRVVKRVRIVHRAPILVVKKVVRITRRPLLQRQATAHRLIVKKTVIR